jgi:hypothetical protein
LLFLSAEKSYLIVGLILSQFEFSTQMLSSQQSAYLIDELLNDYEIAKSDSCRDLIILQFKILDDTKHDEIVNRLLLLHEDKDINQLLTSSTINEFSEMNLNDQTVATIITKLYAFLRDGVPYELYPSIMKFLFSTSSSPVKVIKTVREYMKWDEIVTTNCELKVEEVLCELLRKSLLQVQMFKSWMTILCESKTIK